MSTNTRSLRISSIPFTVTPTEFRGFLEELPCPDRPEGQGARVLAMSLASDGGSRWQTATVCFDYEPETFAKCAQHKMIQIDFTYKGTKYQLDVDCDFFGLTPLYSSNKPAIDIIAVTGLAGHALGSWKAPGRHTVWLRDFLSEDIQDCRILTYGYDAVVQDNNCQNTIQDYGRQFLETVHTTRDREAENRPLILIGHSLGGIIIVQTLCDAAQSGSSRNKAILDSAAGIFLFGAPLGGLDHENLCSIAKGKRNFRLISDLMKDSSILPSLVRSFKACCSVLNEKIISFYETRETITTKVMPDGSIKRKGDPVIMVTRESATILSWNTDNHIPLDGDHSTLVKFTHRSQEGYQNVVRRMKDAKTSSRNRKSSVTSRPFDEKLRLLPHVARASFLSARFDRQEACLEGTRVDLLREITEWASDTESPSLYWLVGMAGTGKSTVARTIAKIMSHRKLLAANFFFTRDEEELSSTTKFFTTLTFQLAEFNPHLRSAIIDKLDHNPDIVHPNQGLRRHWKELIMDPLLSISENDSWREPYVIVIDALDECYDESAVELMIELLGETSSLEGRRLKVFITSRPETHIRYALDDDTDSHKVTVLDKISKDIVDQDIRYYLREQFKLIQRKKRTLLPIHWPGNDSIEQLVRLSDGLFIYAATVCRYIETTKRHPNENLEVTLQSKSPIKGEASGTQNLDTMYLTVLRMALKRSENLQYATTFKKVLGTVLVLAEPVNLEQLSFLCGIEDWRVHGILDFLPAVVGVSSMHDPIRILHKSFGDFLTKKERCMDSNFWIDETVSTYALIALSFSKMSETLVAPDICDLKHPATAANKIDCQVIERSFPTAIQYICRYWAHHLQQYLSLVSPKILRHMLYKRTLKFFQTCFLGWLEAFSLMGKIPDVIAMLQDLQPSLLDPAEERDQIYRFLRDAIRFIMKHRSTIEKAPLQVYISALILSPKNSVVRKCFSHKVPKWIKNPPFGQDDWDPLLQTLEGHSDSVNALAFSPDGKILASGSYKDNTIRLWDPATGASRGTLEGHTGGIYALAFSLNGKVLASGFSDNTLRLWDPSTAILIASLEGHFDAVNTLAFSPDGTILASGSSDSTGWLWDPSTGASSGTLEGHTGEVDILGFSPNGKLLASGSSDNTIRLWDPITKASRGTLEGHSREVNALVFSSDGKLLASGSYDKTVRLWDPTLGVSRGILKGHSGGINTLAFSPDGKLLASGSYDSTIRLWDTASGSSDGALDGHLDTINTLSFSPDGKVLASGSSDNTVRLWDPTTGAPRGVLEGHSEQVSILKFSPDGKLLASGSSDKTVRLWDPPTEPFLTTLEGHSEKVATLVFSPDGRLLASGSFDDTVHLWDPTTGTSRRTLEGHGSAVYTLAFSPDGKFLASGSSDNTLRLWDPAIGTLCGVLEGHSYAVITLAFSPDGKLLASGSYDHTVRLWDPTTGVSCGTLKGHTSVVFALAFSPDGKILASGSHDTTIRIWDPTTRALCGVFEGHTYAVNALAFSPDRKFLASGSSDKTVRFWDTTTQKLVKTFDMGGRIDDISFSANGASLKTNQGPIDLLSVEGTIRELWDMNDGWVSYGQQKLIFLPVDYCGDKLYVNGNCIAWSDSRNRVNIMQLDSSPLVDFSFQRTTAEKNVTSN